MHNSYNISFRKHFLSRLKIRAFAHPARTPNQSSVCVRHTKTLQGAVGNGVQRWRLQRPRTGGRIRMYLWWDCCWRLSWLRSPRAWNAIPPDSVVSSSRSHLELRAALSKKNIRSPLAKCGFVPPKCPGFSPPPRPLDYFCKHGKFLHAP
jgi:hypothetical protein